MKNDVLAVVVTYNRCHMLGGCLDALQRQTIPCDVLVIDNASTDDTQKVLAPYLSDTIRGHRMEQNMGGAGGFNAGMRMGTEEGYRYVWIMDDDAYPNPDALEQLLAAAGQVNDEFGFLSSVVLWKDGTECRMNRQKARKAFFERVDLLQHGMLMIEQATFVSCFFKTDTIRQTGLPITEFFIWGDDIEYTRRLSVRAGLPCYLVGKSIVVHHMGSNIGSDISVESAERLERYSYAYRNENYLYRKEGLKGVAYYVARCGLHTFRILARSKDHRLKRLWILWKAVLKGCAFNPPVEYVKDEV